MAAALSQNKTIAPPWEPASFFFYGLSFFFTSLLRYKFIVFLGAILWTVVFESLGLILESPLLRGREVSII